LTTQIKPVKGKLFMQAAHILRHEMKAEMALALAMQFHSPNNLANLF